MTPTQQMDRIKRLRQDLAHTLPPFGPAWEPCQDCEGLGVDPGSLNEPEPCKACAGTGNEARLIEEEN